MSFYLYHAIPVDCCSVTTACPTLCDPMGSCPSLSPGVFAQVQFTSLTQSCLTLHLHELQHARLPGPLSTPRDCANSCPLSQWCYPTISSRCPLLLPPSIFPSIGVFSNESILCIRWPEYWSFSFSISPSDEYSGLISFRIDWSPCCPRDTQESSPTPQLKSVSSSVFSFLYGPTLTSIHDYWKSHSFD